MTEEHNVEMTLTDEKLREILEAGGVIDRWEVGEATVEGSRFTVPIKLWFTYPGAELLTAMDEVISKARALP